MKHRKRGWRILLGPHRHRYMSTSEWVLGPDHRGYERTICRCGRKGYRLTPAIPRGALDETYKT